MKSCKLQTLPDHAALCVGRHWPVMVAASHCRISRFPAQAEAARSRSAASLIQQAHAGAFRQVCVVTKRSDHSGQGNATHRSQDPRGALPPTFCAQRARLP